MNPTRQRLAERYPALGYVVVFAVIIVLVTIVGLVVLHWG